MADHSTAIHLCLQCCRQADPTCHDCAGCCASAAAPRHRTCRTHHAASTRAWDQRIPHDRRSRHEHVLQALSYRRTGGQNPTVLMEDCVQQPYIGCGSQEHDAGADFFHPLDAAWPGCVHIPRGWRPCEVAVPHVVGDQMRRVFQTGVAPRTGEASCPSHQRDGTSWLHLRCLLSVPLAGHL